MELHEKKTVRVTCAPGLAPYLQREVEAFGFRPREVRNTSLEFNASLHDTMRLNLHLRTAFNVLYLLKEFRCKTPDKLYLRVAAFPWETVIAPDGYVSVVSKVDTPAIDNWTYASLKVKDAIVDRIAQQAGRRPDSGPLRDHTVINVYWIKDECRIFLNTSGRKLADRGYRRIPHSAPMQETLAAGVMLETGYDGTQPLVLPMCGSGTLAIKAALIATGRSPGLLRGNFGFMHTVGFDDTAWQELRREAQKCRVKARPAPIIATDIDERAITAARKNATTAGVDRLIHFAVCDFADTPIPLGAGIVVLNPEYGERLGEVTALEGTYADIGDFYKQRCAGYTGYVFTGNLDLAKKVGLHASRRIPFFNAKIECRLLKYDLYKGSKS